MIKKGDIIILLVVLIIFAYFFINTDKGSTVTVYVNGTIYDTLDINRDSQMVVESDFGYNTITIKDGMVSITDSSCKDHLCEKTSPTNRKGASIICLPNRVNVIINGSSEFDAIVK